MSDEGLTRRRCLGGLGAAVAAGLAGCSGVFGQGSTTADEPATTAEGSATTDDFSPEFADAAESPASSPTDPSTTEPSGTTPSDAATPGADATAAGNGTSEDVSPYTQVYREVNSSVVLVNVQTARGTGQGSGFVYREGYVVTNAHVVSNARNVRVQFAEGEWRSASVVGTDPSSDLAVLQIQNKPDYAAGLPLVETQPPIGTEVVAIGNPFGRFEGSVTSGIVSGVNRLVPAPNGFTIPDAIQTSAPVNPGNSGGPLVNLDGRVVGVVSSGGGENLAFAVSATLVERVVPSLIQNGEYEHASLGVRRPRTVIPRIAEQIGLDRPRGVYIREVLPDGPASGVLQPGDVIVGLDGREIETLQQLSSYLALQASPGDTVQVTVIRDGERRTLEVTLGTRPERPGAGIEPAATPEQGSDQGIDSIGSP